MSPCVLQQARESRAESPSYYCYRTPASLRAQEHPPRTGREIAAKLVLQAACEQPGSPRVDIWWAAPGTSCHLSTGDQYSAKLDQHWQERTYNDPAALQKSRDPSAKSRKAVKAPVDLRAVILIEDGGGFNGFKDRTEPASRVGRWDIAGYILSLRMWQRLSQTFGFLLLGYCSGGGHNTMRS